MKKPLSKSQLAEKIGVSSTTLQRLLNDLWYEELKETGYQKNQRLLTIKQIELIKDLYGNWDE